jgi:type IV pilus assembly protein PilB
MTVDDIEVIPKKRLLGEILIERGRIAHPHLNRALKIQKEEGGYIGEILVHLGVVEDRDIVAALVVQCNLPYIAIDRYEIDRNVLDLVPGEIARRHHVIPLDRVGGILSLVMQDPLDTSVMTHVRRHTHCRIAPFIATRREIDIAIGRWYGQGQDLPGRPVKWEEKQQV